MAIDWGAYGAADHRALSMVGIFAHWIILQYIIGLPIFAVLFEYLYHRKKSKDPVVADYYLRMAKTFSKAMVVMFAVGAVMGTTVEFGLVILWPYLVEVVGIYFFAPLYFEIFAFLAEAVFVYMYYYTWDKVKPKFHLFIGLLAAIGPSLSALMIMSVNSLMQVPPGIIPGYDPATGKWSEPSFVLIAPDGSTLTLTSSELRNVLANDPATFYAVLEATVLALGILWIVFLSPGAFVSFLHAVFASIITTAYTIFGVYAYLYFKGPEKDREFYHYAMKVFSIVGLVGMILQGVVGHALGTVVARYNPEKFAAMEGTSKNITSISKLLGLDSLMAFLAYGDFNAKLPNYDAIPPDWRPPLIIHYLYYAKLALIGLLVLATLIYILYWFILKKEPPKIVLYFGILFPLLVQIASALGWAVREIGRKPWTVYGIFKVGDVATPQPVSPLLVVGVLLYVIVILVGTIYVLYKVLYPRR